VPAHARCPSGAAVARAGPGLEVAEIFRRYLEPLRRSYGLGPQEDRIARDVMACRTAELGGHLEVCTSCGLERPAYNSCRNRHCPKCQALRGARWVEERMERILPVHHFHVVFTLPSELHELARRNRALMLDLLLESAARALLKLGRDPKWLGRSALLGVTSVLHTWARDLHFHPHAHCIVTGGGLALDDQPGTLEGVPDPPATDSARGSRASSTRDEPAWVAAPPGFLVPVHVLGALFRGIFLDGLERYRARGLLRDSLGDRAARRRRARLYDQSWIVYAKRPFGGPQHVYRYLGRYTHRVAISNARLVSIDDDAVVFRTRGDGTASLTPVEFLRRFLDHRLPRGFVKIRHAGLLSPGNVNGRLARARALLSASGAVPPAGGEATYDGERATPPPPRVPRSWRELLLALTGIDVGVCPACGSRALVHLPISRACRGPPDQGRPSP